jgi:hypothetical protein
VASAAAPALLPAALLPTTERAASVSWPTTSASAAPGAPLPGRSSGVSSVSVAAPVSSFAAVSFAATAAALSRFRALRRGIVHVLLKGVLLACWPLATYYLPDAIARPIIIILNIKYLTVCLMIDPNSTVLYSTVQYCIGQNAYC